MEAARSGGETDARTVHVHRPARSLFQEKRFREQAVQASVFAKDCPAQCTVETVDNTAQYSHLTRSDASTQASRVRHHVSTQHYPESRDNCTDTCNLWDGEEMVGDGDDSAIDLDSEHELIFSDVAVQYEQEKESKEVQIGPITMETDSQAEIPDPEVDQLQSHVIELESQRQQVDKMLSQFYIPVQYSDFSPDVDLLRNYLNNMISIEGSRGVALHPGDEKLAEEDNGYLTAANNSPVPVMRRSVDTACNEEHDNFSSFDTESLDHSDSNKIQEELRAKLDLAYKVGTRVAGCVRVSGCTCCQQLTRGSHKVARRS